jgi:hypothetical protein
MTVSDGPWHASEPNELGSVITNPQGRVIAAGVPNPDDAAFICQARAEHHRDVTVRVDWKAFGRAVAEMRKERRFSQDVAAEMCGISRNTVLGERNEHRANYDRRIRRESATTSQPECRVARSPDNR